LIFHVGAIPVHLALYRVACKNARRARVLEASYSSVAFSKVIWYHMGHLYPPRNSLSHSIHYSESLNTLYSVLSERDVFGLRWFLFHFHGAAWIMSSVDKELHYMGG
jgi:hypothetical protein